MHEQLKALLEGLDVPNPEWWMMTQPPEAFRALGKAISDQAKRSMPDDHIERIGVQIKLSAKQ